MRSWQSSYSASTEIVAMSTSRAVSVQPNGRGVAFGLELGKQAQNRVHLARLLGLDCASFQSREALLSHEGSAVVEFESLWSNIPVLSQRASCAVVVTGKVEGFAPW
jgi:hypothetical protein